MFRNLVLTMFVLLFCFTLVSVAADFETANRIWQDRSQGILDLNLVAIDVDNTGRRILSASENRVYLSEDAGRTWRLVFYPQADRRLDIIQVVEIPEEDEIVFEPLEEEEPFDRTDYDVDELFERGILEFGEDFDSISDDELQRRLEDAGLIETPDIDDVFEFDDDDDELPETIEIIEDTDEYHEVLINSIQWDPALSRYAYIGTSHGLYKTSDFGRSWRRMTVTGFYEYEPVYSIAALSPNSALIIAMEEGLYISYDRGSSFEELHGIPSGQHYHYVKPDLYRPGSFAAMSEHDLYLCRIPEYEYAVIAEEIPIPHDTHSIQKTQSGQVFVVQSTALNRLTEGNIWASVNASELMIANTRAIISSEDVLFIATNRGVYLWNETTDSGRFYNMGLTDFDVRDIAVNPAEPYEAWIATASGAYVLASEEPMPDIIPIHFLPDEFPSLEDLIKSSLYAAHINTQRDKQWFDQAQRSTLFPRVDFTWDFAARQREQFTRTSVVSISGGQAYTGPFRDRHALADRERFRIQLRLNWSPNRAIFNRDEISIQQRLRSEVTRRNNTINDVRRLYTRLAQLYYEKQGIMDVQGQIDQLIRIQQTQAQLDALTGHSFDILSKH